MTCRSVGAHRLYTAAQSCSDSDSSCLGQIASPTYPSMKLFSAAGTFGHFHFDAVGVGCHHRPSCSKVEIQAWPLDQNFIAAFDLEDRSTLAFETFKRHLLSSKSVVDPGRRPAACPTPLDSNFQFLQLRHLCVFASGWDRTSSTG